jgi:tRNA (mo5U34)-methyltransferase
LSSAPRVFDQHHYDVLNRARGEVVSQCLAELTPKLNLQTAIDVGCGLGYFSQLLKSRGLSVTGVDGRQQNVEEAQRRNPDIRFCRFDAEDPGIRSLGKFDLVLCFGLLYHLENPMLAIRHLNELTGKLLLVEGVIQPGNETMMALIEETGHEDQGLNHIAFYPTEPCLLKMFYRAGFGHAYTFSTQPNHPEYGAFRGRPRIRTMLAASHNLVDSKLLLGTPEPKSPAHPCTLPETPAKSNATEKIKRFAKKPLREKIKVIRRMVKEKPDH